MGETMALLCPSVRRRAQQQRALRTLDDILTIDGGVRLPPLRWTVEPNSSLTGHVSLPGAEPEIREAFDAWVTLLGAHPLSTVTTKERTTLRAVAPDYGDYLVHVSLYATITHGVRDLEAEVA
jgi:hypothetical protein